MKKICFYGPVDSLQGPGIKNAITIEFLKKNFDVKVFNTFNTSFFNRIYFLVSFLFSNKETVIAVSTRGRKYMFAILKIKRFFNPKFSYSLIIINGYIRKEIEALKKNKKKTYINAINNSKICFVELEGIKDTLSDICDVSRVKVFPNFKNDGCYKDVSFGAEETNNVLKLVFYARVDECKGIFELVSNVKKIREKLPVSLDIYGPVSQNAKSLIDSLEKCEFINYCGIIPNNLSTEVLNNYHLYVFPTKHKREGFPATILEAFVSGLPVICTKICYNNELVKENENGFLYEKDDEFIEKIKYIYNNFDLLRKISINNIEESKKYKASIVFSCFLNDYIGAIENE